MEKEKMAKKNVEKKNMLNQMLLIALSEISI